MKKKGERCTMAEVSYKNFLKSTKANNQKKNSKYSSFQNTKKINISNQNKLSEKKVRHTYLVQQKKVDSSKKKKMSLLEGDVAKKIEIKEFIKWCGVYKWTGLNLEERKNKLIYDMNKLHSEEHMIDDEYIYPRGIDYVQKVILFTHRRIQYLNLTSAEIKQEYEKMDLVWTLEWFEIFSYNEELKINSINDSAFKNREISLKNFLILCQKNRKEFYKIRDGLGNLFGTTKGRERFLTYEECEIILKKNWMKSYVRILSILIGEVGVETLRKEYGFIRFEKKVKNKTLKANEVLKKADLIGLDSLYLNKVQLSKLKKYIYKNHPLQKEFVYDSETNSYYITRDMYQWYEQIYCYSKTNYELFQKDLQYHKDYIHSKNIYLQNNLIAIDDYKMVKKIWKLTEVEYECYVSLFEYKHGKKEFTSYKYEETFQELMLRHIAFIKNEYEKKTSSQSKKRKTLYTKIEDLTFFGIYDGYVENLKATNNHIEIYIHTSYSENLELIKINLNLDWIKQENKKMFMQFLAKGVSIRFKVLQDKQSKEGVLDSFTIRQVLQFDREVKNGKLEYRCII